MSEKDYFIRVEGKAAVSALVRVSAENINEARVIAMERAIDSDPNGWLVEVIEGETLEALEFDTDHGGVVVWQSPEA